MMDELQLVNYSENLHQRNCKNKDPRAEFLAMKQLLHKNQCMNVKEPQEPVTENHGFLHVGFSLPCRFLIP